MTAFKITNSVRNSNTNPHQGKQECARRMRHNPLPSTPRRMWIMLVPFFGAYQSSKRSTLARTRFAKGTAILKPCQIYLR